MKTRVFKKALSVICVLAMLLSLCAVSFVGVASALTTYTFHNSGMIWTDDTLANGAQLKEPTSLVKGLEFLGWYDSTFTNKYDSVSSSTPTDLYAKWSSHVFTFDNREALYDPNNTFGKGGIGGDFTFVADPNPSYTGDMVIEQNFANPGNTNGMNFGLSAYTGINAGLELAAGKYVFSFKYNLTDFNPTDADTVVQLLAYMSKAEGVGVSGNKNATSLFAGNTNANLKENSDGWQQLSLIIEVKQADIDAGYKYLLFGARSGSKLGKIQFDDITISTYSDAQVEYTFYNRGQVEKKSLKFNDKLPVVSSGSFLGWYDSTLTEKYTSAPLFERILYAKYDGTVSNFEYNGVYDPNEELGFGPGSPAIVADPLNANNKVAYFDASKADKMNFAPAGAEGADAGLKLTAGKDYTISFKYYATNVNSKGINIELRATDDHMGFIDIDANSTAAFGSGYKITASTSKWVSGQFNFTYEGTEQYKYLVLCVQNAASDVTGLTDKLYIDDIKIIPNVANISVPDFTMDFEGSTIWSKPEANRLTSTSEYGTFELSEIVDSDIATTPGKGLFLTSIRNKGGYAYFTIDNGTEQFKAVKGGIYSLTMSYKVMPSEKEFELGLIDAELGILLAKPSDANNSFFANSVEVIDEFNNRGDGIWKTVTYNFIANAEAVDLGYTSVGVYLRTPQSSVPEEYAPSIIIDNVSLRTYSTTGEDGFIEFDLRGGDSADVVNLALPVGEAVGEGILESPTKYGYNFSGWKYDVTVGEGDNAVTTAYDFDANTIVGLGITKVYANWTLADGVIEIDFRTNVEEYDNNVQPIVAFAGKPITGMPENPTTSNNKFVGWFYDRAFTKPLDLNCAPQTSSTLYAKWESDGEFYDFENYPESVTESTGKMSDRYKILKDKATGNHYLHHNPGNGVNSDPNAQARIMLYNENGFLSALDGVEYTVSFKYKIENYKTAGKFVAFITSPTNTWGFWKQQDGAVSYSGNTEGWVEASFSFTASRASDSSAKDCIVSISVNGLSDAYIDDVVVTCPENAMNVYGAALRFNSNGGSKVPSTSGDPGEPIVIPATPVRPGYKFVGWYTDNALENPFTAKVYGEEPIMLYAKWQLAKFTEGFEDYPASVKSLGISGAYSFYTSASAGFDVSNIHGGETSLFRNGNSSGVKNFTLMRTADYALKVGDKYTLSFYVKPVAITNDTCTISLYEMKTFTGINQGEISDVVVKISDLKEGEWQQVSYTFTAKSEFLALATNDGVDMYIDDITLNLYGYVGPGALGETNVSPIVVLVFVILSAGALLVTGKKVFAK